MFDRSAAVKLQLRDKKGRFIKMGDHVKWHSLEDNADVSGIARGQSGNNVIVEFSKGGQTYHINVPHNKIEAIDEKAHLDAAYVEKMGGHINTPNPHDVGVTTAHTVTHYAVNSKDKNDHLTTKIGDLKPGDVVYPIKSHGPNTPSFIQKSPFNSKDPSSMLQMQKFNGHGTVKSVVKDKDTGLPKYAVITDNKGKDHFPSASHYAVKKSDHLDNAILKAHADEANAMGKNTPNVLVNEVKGIHTTEDKFNAADAPVGSKLQAKGADDTNITITKTGENEWHNESNDTKLTDAVADKMLGPAPEKSKDGQILDTSGEKKLSEVSASDMAKMPAGTVLRDPNGKTAFFIKGEGDSWEHHLSNGTKSGTISTSAMVKTHDAFANHTFAAKGTEPLVKEDAPAAPEAPKTDPNAPIDISKWSKQGGTQMGSNPGGIYTDENGKQWYVKISQSDDHARTEVLADQLYSDAGVPAAGLKLADVGNGKLGTASPMIDGAKADLSHHLNDKSYMDKIQEGFAVDAWLANWDVAGAVYDNIITDGNGNPVRIDPGGALQYRAQGSPKGDAFGNKAGEWDTLRNNPGSPSTTLFGKMTDQQLVDSADKVAAFDDNKIDTKVDSLGFDKATSDMLKERLKARRDDIVSRADALKPKAAEEPEKAPEAPSAPDAPAASEDHPTYDALDLFAMPNGAHFQSNTDGVKGGYYKQGELWYMSFDPNSKSDGMKVPAHAVITTLASNPSFKLDPESVKKNAPAAPTHAPFAASEGGPGTHFYDQLSKWEKDGLAEEPSHEYEYSDPSSPYSAFPGYNDTEASNLSDYMQDSGGINSALRSSDPSDYNFEIATIDQIIDKSPLKQDIVVYRGLSARDTIIKGIMEGAYSDAGYTSSSTLPKVGHQWIHSVPSSRTPLFMEIHLPAGFKAHKLDYNGLNDGDNYKNESEVLLPHGTVYTVSHKEEYTNAEGQKGWKVTMTPILDEHNFDTGETHDTGTEAPAVPEGSQPEVHDAGGEHSGVQPGGNEDHAGAVPSPTGATEEKPEEAVAPTEPSSAHPDFTASYPDKGKDQIDANGTTVKVNDLVLHPKKGVGKVSIGLPSTKSVKVVYQDGSTGTHLAKAVTKVEGAAPELPALPADLKVGDHGIDPATHTKFIVGTNNSLIHIGDTVTHSSGDTGTVKAIYKGEKTVSVQWDKGGTSTKKASTLESDNKHNTGEPATPAAEAPAAPAETAPSTPETHDEAPAVPEAPSEPVAEAPQAPTEPEVVPEASPTASPEPFDGKKLSDVSTPLDQMPVGTTITSDTHKHAFRKLENGDWQAYKQDTGNDMFSKFSSEQLGKNLEGIGDTHTVHAPKDPADAPHADSAPAAAEDLVGKTPDDLAKLSPEDFAKLPVGTILHKHSLASFYQKKIGENEWQMMKTSTNQPAFGHTNSDDSIQGILKNSPGMYESTTIPETPAEPAALDLTGKTADDVAKLSPEDFAKIPVGTTLHKDNPDAAYYQKKVGENQWKTLKNGTGAPAFTFTTADTTVHDLLKDNPGLYKSVKLPDTADAASPATPSVLEAVSETDLEKLPEGAVITDPAMEGYSYTKKGGEWQETTPSGHITPYMYPSSTIADGTTYHVQQSEGSHAPTPVVPEASAPADSNGFSEMSPESLDALPVGTKVESEKSFGGEHAQYYWIKQGDGKWKEFDEKNGYEATGSEYTSNVMQSGLQLKVVPTAEPQVTGNTYVGKTLTDILESGDFKNLPMGSELHNEGNSSSGPIVYKKTALDSWEQVDPANGQPVVDHTYHNDMFSGLSSHKTDAYVVKSPSTPDAPEKTGAAILTGVSGGHELSKELLDAQPAGTSMKKESAYGSSAFYYIKQPDSTWKLFKNGQEKGTYTSDNIKAVNTTATLGVPTAGSKFFYSKSGEITYEGDKVDYKGTPGKITSITDTGLVAVKLDGESKAKYKAASQLIKTPTYGQKDAPTYHPAPTPDLSTTPSADNHTGGSDTLNFAGASGAAYDQQGLKMPATTSDTHLSNGLTLAPTHAPDTSNPLYGTPEPQEPASPEAYPAFNADAIEPLPKWDSAKWLEAVKARYDANPHKAKATLEESAKWNNIQSILNGEKIHIDSLLQSKYLDDNLKQEAINGITAQEEKNKPLIEAHNAKVAEAKKQYDAAKAAHIAQYDAKKQAYQQQHDSWVAANPNQNAMKPINLPETSKDSFTGGAADWSKAHAGTFSAKTVFDSIKSDNQLGTKGLSIATDSDQVEALDANVMKILNSNGKPVLQVKMKLTGPYGAAFEKTLKNQDGVTKTNGIFSNHLVTDPETGLLKDHGKPDQGWVNSGTRYTWTDPSTGAVVDFQRSFDQGMNVSANNNTVRIHLPENATPEDYQKVLENMGVNAKPSTEGDIRVLAENQLLSMMGKSTANAKIYDGNINLSGASRSNQLKQIQEKYGITADDMIFSSEANGRVRFFLKDDKAQALTEQYGVKSFVHNVSGYGADTWVNMLTGPNNGLLSTFHRWNEGIGGNGMSSMTDHSYGSSDYVYITPKSSLPSSGHGSSVVINPKAIFRRTDWWANKSDSYGKKGDGTSISPYNLLDSVTGGSSYGGGIHEALPKDSVPVSDWMYVNMDSGTRMEVIKTLKEKGVLQINGIPIEDFIRSSSSVSKASSTMPVVG